MIIDNNVSTIYGQFNDPNASKKMVATNNISAINNWVQSRDVRLQFSSENQILHQQLNIHNFHSRCEHVQCIKYKGLVCHKYF